MTRKEKIEQQALLDEDAYADNNYHAFKRGVEWSDENPKEGLVNIDKVCKYLESLVYQEFGGGPLERTFSDEDIEDFRKAMKG